MTQTTEITIAQPRLPYPKGLKDRFGLEVYEWKTLCEAIFPSAKTPESVVLALSYCKSRNLDVMKKPVHIVPVWMDGKEVETVWPGIAEIRTTATRTGEYAGMDAMVYGPDSEKTWDTTVKKWIDGRSQDVKKKITIKFPEWGQLTVYKMVAGQRCAFVGPRVDWMEIYSSKSKKDDCPNSRWQRAPRGQFTKCVEAASLRAAFPEELASMYAAEEMHGKSLDINKHDDVQGVEIPKKESIEDRLNKINPNEIQDAVEVTTEPVDPKEKKPDTTGDDEEAEKMSLRGRITDWQIQFGQDQRLSEFNAIMEKLEVGRGVGKSTPKDKLLAILTALETQYSQKEQGE